MSDSDGDVEEDEEEDDKEKEEEEKVKKKIANNATMSDMDVSHFSQNIDWIR